ncbi:MAG: hypothetical protein H0W78_09190 [Planctomycetes bacterium]|nr:hypothetical protein [Planctomycetota bacterium]
MPVFPGRWSALVWLLLVIAGLPAVDAAQRNPAAEVNDSEIEERYVTRIQEEAANYRLARSHVLVSAETEALGEEYVRQTQAILDTGADQQLESAGHWLSPQWWFVSPSPARRAQWLAQDGFAAVPYSRSAGELLALEVRALAKRGSISGLYNALYRLWYFMPDYGNMPAVMHAAMDAAEREQNYTAAIDLTADDPRDVISLGSNSSMGEINRLFHFMVLHGDRVQIAPRAALGLARSLLRSSDRDDLFLARREFERFCETYPTHPLIFNALTDRALSYLVSYRGEHYDVGSLISAAAIIDQAEIEADGDKERIRVVEAFRTRIRSWHQDRDLQVARWYAQRVQPGLAWLSAPKAEVDRPWIQSARYYYREVIRRDSGSTAGRAAALELAELPLPTAGELGAPQPLPPTPAPAP